MFSCLVSKPCFLSFSTQSHAESFGNYFKKSVLNWQYAKLNQTIFFTCIHLEQMLFLTLQTTFFDSFKVLLNSLVEKCYRTNMKLPQKASLGSETCEIWPKVAIWGFRRRGFPPEDSPSFPEHLESSLEIVQLLHFSACMAWRLIKSGNWFHLVHPRPPWPKFDLWPCLSLSLSRTMGQDS